jgi:hypothetical protein
MKWFTVSKNPTGYLVNKTSVHVEPGKVSGDYHILAKNKKDAIIKTYGNIKPKLIKNYKSLW